MDNGEKVTLNQIKEQWSLNYSINASNIAVIFKNEYNKYVQNPTSYEGQYFNFEKLLNNCEGMKPQLIPYSALTEIIFKNDMTIQSIQDKEIGESNFAVIIENRFEQYLINKYGVKGSTAPDGEEQTPFSGNEVEIDVERIEKDKSKITICYKIFEHLKLAISQKEGLYEKQTTEINTLTNSIENTTEKYENMTSNYISILGIFAAILMTAFGGIQSFTSIYQNNSYPLDDSLLIACIGFMGIILLIFLLMNSIAKLTGNKLDSKTNSNKWYLRHPTLINSFILLSTIILVILMWKVINNPEEVTQSYFLFLLPLVYCTAMTIWFNKEGKKWYFLWFW